MSIRRQFGVIVGPAIGGLIIAAFSVTSGYGVDVATFLISLVFLARVGSVPALEKAAKPSLTGLLEGFRYASSRQDLLGTYLIDLAAMFLAMPNALIPFWADQLGAPWALGLLYSAGTVGAIAVTLTSGWATHYRFHGRTIILAAVGWGVAISLAGIELLSYSVGPLAGQIRAASVASVTSLAFSVTSGGVLCIIAVIIMAIFLPKLRRYDVATDIHAAQEREKRKFENGFTTEI